MPIRFRCAYCNQLMGIARRKAGTVVKCPTCAGQVVVPDEEGEAADAQVPATKSSPAQNLLEREDFDRVFEQSQSEAHPVSPPAPPPAISPPAPPPAATGGPGPIDVEMVPAPDQDFDDGEMQGIFITSRKATVLTVVAILLIALAFGGGVLVGRFVLQ